MKIIRFIEVEGRCLQTIYRKYRHKIKAFTANKKSASVVAKRSVDLEPDRA